MERKEFLFDCRTTEEGQWRLDPLNSKIYNESVKFQDFLFKNGIAWHNPFSNECTADFACCIGDKNYKRYFPSRLKLLEYHFDELFQQIKHGDQEHQDWLKQKMQNYLKELTK